MPAASDEVDVPTCDTCGTDMRPLGIRVIDAPGIAAVKQVWECPRRHPGFKETEARVRLDPMKRRRDD